MSFNDRERDREKERERECTDINIDNTCRMIVYM